jgi:hypothetical protein
MTRLLLYAALLAAVISLGVSAAYAAGWGIFQEGRGVVSGCSNSLDFTQSCNSQYIGVI